MNNIAKVADYAAAHFAAFQEAQRRFSESFTRLYAIGGAKIALSFAGPALFDIITPSLAHLEIPSRAKADLTIYLWDSASTGTAFPAPPWDIEPLVQDKQRWGFNSDRFASVFKPINGTWHLLDKQLQKALYWAPDFKTVPFVDRAFPLRTILNWWMQARGRQIIHGAAVGNGDGGVLILGPSEAGKSTVSLACLAAGMVFFGDDNILLRLDSDPYLYSLYSSAKLYPDDLPKFPFLSLMSQYKSRKETEKILLFLSDLNRRLLPEGTSFNTVLLPRISANKEHKLIKVSAAQSLKTAAPHSIFTFNRDNPGILKDIAGIFRHTSHYILELGTNTKSLPAVMADLIKSGRVVDQNRIEVLNER